MATASMKRYGWTSLGYAALGVSLLLAFPASGWAQEAAETAVEQASRTGIVDLILAAGIIGHTIILLSVAAVALGIEHLITIRRGALIPPGMAEEVFELVAQGNLTQAEQVCKLRPSYLGYLLLSGLQEVRQGYAAVEKAVEDAAIEQSARLFRKIEYLSVIANVSTMLGLLGTVVGLVMAFKRVAETQGAARAADLAGGVYLALVTTVEGLVVAIPAVAAFAIFRNRVDQLGAEATLLSDHIFRAVKRSRPVRRPQPSTVEGSHSGAE